MLPAADLFQVANYYLVMRLLHSALLDKIVHLETVIDSMENDYKSVVLDNEECHNTIKMLVIQLDLYRSSPEVKSGTLTDEKSLKTTIENKGNELNAEVKV